MDYKDINKRVYVPVEAGTLSERMAADLESRDKKGRGYSAEILRLWSKAGYQLQEIGGGILHSWVAMESEGELHGMDRAQKASVLISLLERVAGEQYSTRNIKQIVDADDVVKPLEPPAPEPEPEPEPLKKAEPEPEQKLPSFEDHKASYMA